MKKQKTLWKNPETKYKPRNRQAAKIMFPAKGLHLPPVVLPKPLFLPTFQEILEAESTLRKEVISKAEHDNAVKEIEIKRKIDKRKAEQWNRKMNRFKSKQQRTIQRLSEKIARRLA